MSWCFSLQCVHAAVVSAGKAGPPTGIPQLRSRHPPPSPLPPPDIPHAISLTPSDSAMTEATLALEGTASNISGSHTTGTSTSGLTAAADTAHHGVSPTFTSEAAADRRPASARAGAVPELLTASGSVGTSTPTSALARRGEGAEPRVPISPLAPHAANSPQRVSQEAASPAARTPPSPPFHPGSATGAVPSWPLTGSSTFDGSPHSGAANHSESDTYSDFIPALNPPSPSNYTPCGVPWRAFSPSGSMRDPASPMHSGDVGQPQATPDHPDGNAERAQQAQRASRTRGLQSGVFFGLRSGERDGHPPGAGLQRHKFSGVKAAAGGRGSGAPPRHVWPQAPEGVAVCPVQIWTETHRSHEAGSICSL